MFHSVSFLDTLAEIASKTNPIDSNINNNINNNYQRPRAMSEPYIRNNNNHLTTMKKDQINLVIPLPQALEKYSSIYNKNGRIGIYTREERDLIITRFYEKRKRRIWKKKIRYHCRKNLADSRVRVKGRFVKNLPDDDEDMSEEDEETVKDALGALLKATETEIESSLSTPSNYLLYLSATLNHGEQSSTPSSTTTSSSSHNSSNNHNNRLRNNNHNSNNNNGNNNTGKSVSTSSISTRSKRSLQNSNLSKNSSSSDHLSDLVKFEEIDADNSNISNHSKDNNNDNNQKESSKNNSTTTISTTSSILETVRSRKRIRRHSIAY